MNLVLCKNMATRTLIPSEDDSKTSLDADYYVVMISSLSLCLREVGAPKHTVFGGPKVGEPASLRGTTTQQTCYESERRGDNEDDGELTAHRKRIKRQP